MQSASIDTTVTTDSNDVPVGPCGIDVAFHNVSISILNKSDRALNKEIIHPINTTIEGGTLFAILGGSGSGKTTLLNVIAGRYSSSQFEVGGKIKFGGSSKCSIGYVTQQDYLLPHLTVRETLMFAAHMKVNPKRRPPLNAVNTTAKKMDIYSYLTENVIQELGLKECANSKIGDTSGTTGGTRGLSGGEQRRVSIAIQIIADCKVLCADEPTSGLDSFTAITVIQALYRLTRGVHHTTVISSIHQPRADVFRMFDGVLLLSKGGHAIYFGPTRNIVTYFAMLGYDCPSDSNPADYFVDLSSIDARTAASLASSKQRVLDLSAAFSEQRELDLEAPHHAHGAHQGNRARGSSIDTDGSDIPAHAHVSKNHLVAFRRSWLVQVYFLQDRFFRNTMRDAMSSLGGLMQAGILGAFLMGIFWQLSDSLTDIQSRNGLFYVVASMEVYILTVMLTQRYCTELKVFDRELQDELYAPSAYLTAHIITTLPLLVAEALLYSLPIYFGSNLREGWDHLGMFVAVNCALMIIINGLVWACVALHRDFAIASLIANVQFSFISLTAGYLVNYNDIPVYVNWVRYLSFIGYGYRIFMSNEYSNRILDGCPSPNPADCVLYSGNYILNSQGIEVNDFQDPWIALGMICLVYYAFTYVWLSLVRHPVTGIVGSSTAAKSEKEEEMVPMSSGKATRAAEREYLNDNMRIQMVRHAPVTITVKGVYLFVKGARSKPEPLIDSSNRAQQERAAEIPVSANKMILSDINATLKPGRLVALMGGSGSGKTTLLNLIAGRISFRHISFGREKTMCGGCIGAPALYEGTGDVLFNKQVPTSAKRRDLIGYVQQSDQHVPSLTVLETLTFHANLRLPQEWSVGQRKRRVQQVLNTLDLQPCASTRVGDEEVKGISGGEKRRLSLGVQLLGDPAVCLLDEPTTGLDTFTARHVVQTLQQLAHRGRTMITSIHQPRYDVFALLDDVILLSRGRLVWSGSSEAMLKHFAAMGHPCPPLTNPADFILDISSIDSRSPEKEKETKMLLHSLIKGRRRPVKPPKPANLPRLTHLDTEGPPPGPPPQMPPASAPPTITAAPLEPPAQHHAPLPPPHPESVKSLASQGSEISSVTVGSGDTHERVTAVNMRRVVKANAAHVTHVAMRPANLPPRQVIGPPQHPEQLVNYPPVDVPPEAPVEEDEDEGFGHFGSPDVHSAHNAPLPPPRPDSLPPPARPPRWSVNAITQRFEESAKNADLTRVATVAKAIYITLPLLLRRSGLNIRRQPTIAVTRIAQGTFYALILACFYAPLSHDQNSVQNRIGNLYELTTLVFIGMLGCIAIFPRERNVFYREYVDGDYSALAFFLAYFIIALPFVFATSLIVAALMTYAVNLQPDLIALAIYTGVFFCFIFAGECLGVMICSLFNDIGFSVSIMSVVLCMFTIMSGFMSLSMPFVLRYISYASPVVWGAWIMTNVAFAGEKFTCDTDQLDTLGRCPISTGEEVLALYNMENTPVYGIDGMLWHTIIGVGVTLIYFVIAFAAVRGRAFKLSH